MTEPKINEKLQRGLDGIRIPFKKPVLDLRLHGIKFAHCRGCYKEWPEEALDSEGWCQECSRLPKEGYIPGAPGQGSY